MNQEKVVPSNEELLAEHVQAEKKERARIDKKAKQNAANELAIAKVQEEDKKQTVSLIDSLPDYEQTRAIEDKPFRMSGIAYMITYQYHIDKKAIIQFFNDKVRGTKKTIEMIEIAHEAPNHSAPVDAFGNPMLDPNGDPLPIPTPYEHTHVVVLFNVKPDWTRSDSADIPTPFQVKPVHPNIKQIYGGKYGEHFSNAIRYLAKEDPANASLLTYNREYIYKIWQSKTMDEALKLAKKPADIIGIKMAFEMKPKEQEPDRECHLKELGGSKYDANEMQKLIIDTIKRDNGLGQDDRQIMWIKNRIGKVGKSMLAGDLMTARLAHVIANNGGGSRDVATNLESAIAGGWDGKCILFDFSRAIGRYEREGIYTVMEDIKNGMVAVAKFASKTIRLKQCPTIIILANFGPRIWAKQPKHKKTKEIPKERLIELMNDPKKKLLPKTIEDEDGTFIVSSTRRLEPTISLDRWKIVIIDQHGNVNLRATKRSEKQLIIAKDIYEKQCEENDDDSDLNAFDDESD